MVRPFIRPLRSCVISASLIRDRLSAVSAFLIGRDAGQQPPAGDPALSTDGALLFPCPHRATAECLQPKFDLTHPAAAPSQRDGRDQPAERCFTMRVSLMTPEYPPR